MKKYDCVYCGGSLPRCSNNESKSFLYFCGEYPGTGPGVCECSHLIEEYRYGMRLRGFSPGCQPKGTIRREDDSTGKYWDIIIYDRQLSEKEMSDYELDDLN